ncbi:MAG TPA: hypothetical protein VGK00_12830 [Anaerolineales bacterium]|jgi:hypothetical protein
MLKTKMFVISIMVAVVLIIVSGTALAAPAPAHNSAAALQDATTPTPTESATPDPSGTPVAEPTVTPTVTPTQVSVNPVSSLIAFFFGVDPTQVDGFHQDGSGFGEIAQACWMSYQLKGDGSECGSILAAKKSGDYSNLGLPDGVTVSNWGQFKKAVSEKKNNLGSIVSGHADSILTSTPEATAETTGTPEPSLSATPGPATLLEALFGNGNGNGNAYGQSKQHGNGKGQGHSHYPKNK